VWKISKLHNQVVHGDLRFLHVAADVLGLFVQTLES